MDFEVDTDELKMMEKRFADSSSSFSDEIKNIKDQVEILKKIWYGIDADSFYDKIDAYLIKLEMLSETDKIFSSAFKQSYINYEENDNELMELLKTENSQYEDEEFIASGGIEKTQEEYFVENV